MVRRRVRDVPVFQTCTKTGRNQFLGSARGLALSQAITSEAFSLLSQGPGIRCTMDFLPGYSDR